VDERLGSVKGKTLAFIGDTAGHVVPGGAAQP
jgi:hypothetical protein